MWVDVDNADIYAMYAYMLIEKLGHSPWDSCDFEFVTNVGLFDIGG